MTPEQKDLVQASFEKVAPIADVAATIFYNRLFALDPALRPLFPEDLVEQRRKLMATLGVAVLNLKQWDRIQSQVRELGKRHVAYGVKPKDYGTVGQALIETLAIGLKDDFTPPVRDAWLACYSLVSAEMNNTAHEAV